MKITNESLKKQYRIEMIKTLLSITFIIYIILEIVNLANIVNSFIQVSKSIPKTLFQDTLYSFIYKTIFSVVKILIAFLLTLFFCTFTTMRKKEDNY